MAFFLVPIGFLLELCTKYTSDPRSPLPLMARERGEPAALPARPGVAGTLAPLIPKNASMAPLEVGVLASVSVFSTHFSMGLRFLIKCRQKHAFFSKKEMQ